MDQLILVRHSISAPNPNMTPRQWSLSSRGRELCQILARRLAQYRPDIIITSDEPKAIETGIITGMLLDIPSHIMRNLHEHERHGVPWFDNVDAFNTLVEQFFAQPEQLVFGQEMARQALERFSKAVADVLAAYPEQKVAVVTHGTVMSLFVGERAEINTFPFWVRLGMPAFVVFNLPYLDLIRVVEQISPEDALE